MRDWRRRDGVTLREPRMQKGTAMTAPKEIPTVRVSAARRSSGPSSLKSPASSSQRQRLTASAATSPRALEDRACRRLQWWLCASDFPSGSL